MLKLLFGRCTRHSSTSVLSELLMPMYACQLWSKYTQTSMKRLRAAYNNAYRIMHYIPRNVSVRPHQVSHCVRLDLWCHAKKQLASILYAMHIFMQLFYSIASNVWCFLQIFIFPQLFNTPIWRPNAVVVRELFRSLGFTSIAFV